MKWSHNSYKDVKMWWFLWLKQTTSLQTWSIGSVHLLLHSKPSTQRLVRKRSAAPCSTYRCPLVGTRSPAATHDRVKFWRGGKCKYEYRRMYSYLHQKKYVTCFSFLPVAWSEGAPRRVSSSRRHWRFSRASCLAARLGWSRACRALLDLRMWKLAMPASKRECLDTKMTRTRLMLNETRIK